MGRPTDYTPEVAARIAAECVPASPSFYTHPFLRTRFRLARSTGQACRG